MPVRSVGFWELGGDLREAHPLRFVSAEGPRDVAEFAVAECIRFIERPEHDVVAGHVHRVDIHQNERNATAVINILGSILQSIAIRVARRRVRLQNDGTCRQFRMVETRRVVERRRVHYERRDITRCIDGSYFHAPVAVCILDAVVQSVVIGVRFVRIRDGSRDQISPVAIRVVAPR